MLTIRDAQMQRLGEIHDDALAQTITQRLNDDCPEYGEQLGAARVGAAVRAAVHDAREFGLASDQEVGEFVGLVFVCGERFYEREAYRWAAELLRSEEPARVRRVSDRVAAQLQAMAAGAR